MGADHGSTGRGSSSGQQRGRARNGPQKRDPFRRDSILAAAAALVGERGYAGVAMADIGAAVGIGASAIYWHFPSKQTLLVALFDRSLDSQLSSEKQALDDYGWSVAALSAIVSQQVDFVVDERNFARVYYREANNIDADDQLRMRQKQRRYVDVWTRLIGYLDPEASEVRCRVRVHATIGAIQSALVYSSPLPAPEQKAYLRATAMRILLPNADDVTDVAVI